MRRKSIALTIMGGGILAASIGWLLLADEGFPTSDPAVSPVPKAPGYAEPEPVLEQLASERTPASESRPAEQDILEKSEPARPPSREAPPGQGVVSGTAVDDRGAPVPLCEVVLLDARDESEVAVFAADRGGRFRLQLDPGEYPLFARAQGHAESARVLALVPAEGLAPSLSLVLPREGIMAGQVLLPDDLVDTLPRFFRLIMEVSPEEDPQMWLAEEPSLEPTARVLRKELWVGVDRLFELRGCEPGFYRMRIELPRPGRNRSGRWMQTWIDPGVLREGLRLSLLQELEPALKGRALDDLGEPLAGVRVETGSHLAASDQQGRFTLNGLDIGPHRVLVSLPGHVPFHGSLDYLGELLELELKLERTGRIQGRVAGASTPVTVFLAREDEQAIALMSEPDGHFLRDELRPGRYSLWTEREKTPVVTRIEPGRLTDVLLTEGE